MPKKECETINIHAKNYDWFHYLGSCAGHKHHTIIPLNSKHNERFNNYDYILIPITRENITTINTIRYANTRFRNQTRCRAIMWCGDQKITCWTWVMPTIGSNPRSAGDPYSVIDSTVKTDKNTKNMKCDFALMAVGGYYE